ncbi:Nrap protein [Sparassis latifolia]
MSVDRKRKRNDAGRHSEKRPHTSPGEGLNETESPDEPTDHVDGAGSLSVDSDEEKGSESEQTDQEWAGLNGTKAGEGQGTEHFGLHTGTHPQKPPKGEELRDIKDATDLYRSTSFKLQIDAILPSVRPRYKRSTPLDRFLLSLHTFFNALPSIPPQHPIVASRDLLKKGIAVPYPLPLPTEDTNWKVSFEKPSEILLVGSWALKTSVKAKDGNPYNVDIAVAMPETLFQEKDYLHSRYFHKRAYYLAVIAASIADKNSGFTVNVSYESVGADPRLTTLVLRPKLDESSEGLSKLHAQIRIVPMLPNSSPIPLQRLGPSRSNIRTSDDASKDIPTPLYNTAILLSMTPKVHFLSMHSLQESVPAFTDALTLLRVWANQRGYGVGNRFCIRGFEGKGIWWASLLELLVSGEEPSTTGFGKSLTKRKPLGKNLSSYQMFKGALDFLSRHDFSEEHIFLKTKNGHRYPTHDYESHEAVFVDSSSMVNLLAGVPLCSLDMLKYDAQLTLEILESSTMSDDPFQSVFLKEQRALSTRFDVITRVDVSSAKLHRPHPQDHLENGSAYNALLATLISVLRRGLGNRAKAIAILHPSSQLRPASQAQPANPATIYIGIILDTEHAFRLVDHGPTAAEQDSAAAQEFRDFWGEKAELRRFKDGSIVESVVWAVGSADERTHIPSFIIRHLLQRHCGIPDDTVHTWQAQFDDVLKLPESVASLYRAANASVGYKAAMTAFDNFVKTVKTLDKELPLGILTVSPITELLRYTSVFSPAAVPASSLSVFPQCAHYVAPMELILEFEKSGRWPNDLRGIQKIKLAFLERLATALMAANKGMKAAVVTGDGVISSEIQDQAQLEVLTPEGWAFTARIWHDREATLLEKIIDDKPQVPKHLKRESGLDGTERRAAQEAQEIYRRRFIHSPRHHRAIAALSHLFSAFAGTVRLVKRWFASHWLLHGHVSEEVVELLCASIFLRKGKNVLEESAANHRTVPGTKERGFAQVIEMLKDWQWANGSFVPLYGSTAEGGDVEEPSITVAAGARAGVWTVTTELDREGHIWTSSGPDAIVARRINAIARATWECLQGIEGNQFDVKTLFTHPLEHYDFIVDLEPSILPRYAQNIAADANAWVRKGKYANVQATDDARTVLPGFDPAQLLYDDLKRIYKDTLMLFHDPLGGNRFGAVLMPTLKNPRPFKVLGGYSSISDPEKSKDKDKSLVVLNENAVLSEIKRLGYGLIKGIIVQV